MAKDRPVYPSENADKYVVRFPDGMRDLIAETAKRNNRTMNAEIVARLAASFAAVDSEHLARDPTGELHPRMLALEKRMAVEDALEALNARMDALERMATELPTLTEEIRRALPETEKLRASQERSAKKKE